ncbi:MAG: DNA-binding protein [Betaproteobacteria bacterium]|nr:DNA-binding protein [Betaproteobacteria bacterium]
MSNYNELMKQAQDLMAKAEQVRKEELATVISEIKAKMKQYGITVSDLGGTSGGKAAKSKSAAPAKYRGPNGELWAGGPGRKPQWVRDLIESGKSIESYRI